MKTQATWKNWLLAGVTAGAVGLTALTFDPQASLAQSTDSTPTQPAAPTAGTRGLRGDRGIDAVRPDDNHAELLAAALGITVDELTVAQTAAKEAGLALAVTQGLLTQEQADAMQARAVDGGRGFDGGHFLGRGADGAIDGQQLLADALGITVEQLESATEAAFSAGLAQAVTEGTMTQEQADLMVARRAFGAYAAAQAQTVYADALAAAVESGAITQAQADLLSDAQGQFGHGGMKGGRGGHGGGFAAPDAQP